MNIYEKLSNIQRELKAPKGQYNSFGKYKYRSCEDILEAVKPICKKYDSVLVLGDELKNIGERYYIKASAELIDLVDGTSININAYAREDLEKKGMDGSQITGTASSYARKYALNGLFNIDDTKDADTDEYKKQQEVNENEKINQIQENDLISSVQEKAIRDLANKVDKDHVIATMKDFGYEKFAEIKQKDYMSIVKNLESGKRN